MNSFRKLPTPSTGTREPQADPRRLGESATADQVVMVAGTAGTSPVGVLAAALKWAEHDTSGASSLKPANPDSRNQLHEWAASLARSAEPPHPTSRARPFQLQVRDPAGGGGRVEWSVGFGPDPSGRLSDSALSDLEVHLLGTSSVLLIMLDLPAHRAAAHAARGRDIALLEEALRQLEERSIRVVLLVSGAKSVDDPGSRAVNAGPSGDLIGLLMTQIRELRDGLTAGARAGLLTVVGVEHPPVVPNDTSANSTSTPWLVGADALEAAMLGGTMRARDRGRPISSLPKKLAPLPPWAVGRTVEPHPPGPRTTGASWIWVFLVAGVADVLPSVVAFGALGAMLNADQELFIWLTVANAVLATCTVVPMCMLQPGLRTARWPLVLSKNIPFLSMLPTATVLSLIEWKSPGTVARLFARRRADSPPVA